MARTSSIFTSEEIDLTLDAELLPMAGATSDCYRVKLYGKWFFLKRLKEGLRSSPRYLALLRKEFETGFQLEHPNIVRYERLGEDFIIMEYVDGVTLTEFIATHPEFFNDKDDTGRLLSQLLDAVEYLHSHQVVHLDLKPDNIMITRIGNDVKIIDLGFCYTDSFQDTTGGTESFASPEQFNGGTVDERSDIFAIGRILKQLPCASRYRSVIARCTADEPSRRYSTVRAVRAALHHCHTRSRNLAVVAVVALGVLALAAYLAARPGSVDPAAEATIDATATRDTVIEAPAPAPATTATDTTAVPTQQPALPPATTRPTVTATPDPAALHDKVLAWMKPRFEQEFGAYRDSAFSEIDWNLFGDRFATFRSLQYRQYVKTNKGAYEERDISYAWSDVILALDRELVQQMRSNDTR